MCAMEKYSCPLCLTLLTFQGISANCHMCGATERYYKYSITVKDNKIIHQVYIFQFPIAVVAYWDGTNIWRQVIDEENRVSSQLILHLEEKLILTVENKEELKQQIDIITTFA